MTILDYMAEPICPFAKTDEGVKLRLFWLKVDLLGESSTFRTRSTMYLNGLRHQLWAPCKTWVEQLTIWPEELPF